MVGKYNTVTKTVTAIQFTFDVLKDIYSFLGYADVTYSVKNRALMGVITDPDGIKLSVNKNDFIVKDLSGRISIWKAEDFKKEFTEVKTSA